MEFEPGEQSLPNIPRFGMQLTLLPNFSQVEWIGRGSAPGLVPLTSRHGAELEITNIVTWNIEATQMGVGGDTLWSRPVHEPYVISPVRQKYRYKLTPYNTTSKQ